MILKPDYNLKNIYEIKPDVLKKQGIKAIFFDLDSTIMVSKSGKFLEETLSWFEKFQKDFYIAIITNNRNKEYLKEVKSQCNYKIIENAKKPFAFSMKQLITHLFMKPKEIVMVGDRPLTDVLAGKLIGTKTILVGSIDSNERKIVKFVRAMERLSICPFCKKEMK